MFATGRIRRSAVRPALLAAALLPALASAQAAPPEAAGRFAGWDALRDPSFVFDPDERPMLGFSVRATPDARVALAAAEAALGGPDPLAAARALQDAVWLHATDVVQVEAGAGRWVGAGEWALYLLTERVPAATREAACASSDRSALLEAESWRDVARLRTLAWRLEGLPEGAQASSAAARLLAESGAREAGRAAADRARLVATDAALDALAARLAPPPESPPPVSGVPAELRPLWNSPLLVAGLATRNPFALRGGDEAPIAPVVPVVRDGVVYICDSLSTEADDLLSGRRLWRHAGPIEVVEQTHARDRWFSFDKYVDNWRTRAVSPFQLAQPAVAEGRVVSVEQAAERVHELNDFEGIPIDNPLPERRLTCLDAATGAELWRQERPELSDDDFVNRLAVCGAPVIADGAVFATGYILEGAINAYLAAFDLADGSLLWRTFLCSGQQDLTMFNRPFQEHTPSPPLLVDGALYACTNLGVVACVDAFAGRVRWLAGYDFVPRRASRSPDRDLRREVLWVNRAPQLVAGNVLVMPLDAQQALALDPATGRQRWELDTQRPDREHRRHDALALPDGRIAVSSDDRVEICDGTTGRLQFGVALPDDEHACGPLSLSGSQLLQPGEDSLVVLDLAGDVRSPRALPWDEKLRADPVSRHARMPRRVVASGRALVVTDAWSVHAIVDVEGELQDALARGAHDPAARVAAGELLVAAGRLADAAAQLDAALADAALPAALHERARAARLRAALAAALDGKTRADWLALLDCGRRLGDPFAFAEEALIALDALGAQDDASSALLRLAARDPARRLSLGARSGGQALPAGLLAALVDPPRETPEAKVARLQGLIEAWPSEAWQGGTIRSWAAERIAAVLDAVGRAPYSRWEVAAAAALAQATDADALADVEARYPNASAVRDARSRRLEQWLAAGRARDVLADLARPPLGGYGEEGRAVRERAALAAGEIRFAAALHDGPLAPADLPLPALPASVGGPLQFDVSARGRVVFPPIEGRIAEAFRGDAIGCVNFQGELFLLEAATGKVLWRKPLPPGVVSGSPGYVELHADGDRLLLLTYARQGVTSDHVEARSLRDGELLWSGDLPGETRAVVTCDGLLLRLARLDPGEGDGFRLTGYGTGSGAAALQLDVPDCQGASLLSAGGRPVLFTDSELSRDGTTVDPRMWAIDTLGGRLVGGGVLPDDCSRVLLALDVPPTMLLASRGSPDRPPMLLGWSATTGGVAFEQPVTTPLLSRQVLFPAGEGRALLFSSEMLAQGGTSVRLVPVDARLGPLPETTTSLPLAVLPGQSSGRVPRLVLARTDDPTRLVVEDARTAEHLFDVVLPAALGPYSTIVHGRDGFALVQESGATGGDTVVRLFDGTTGAERYSGTIEAPHGLGRAQLVLVEGALVMAWGGTVHVLRSGGR